MVYLSGGFYRRRSLLTGLLRLLLARKLVDGCWGCLGIRVAALAVVLRYITGSAGSREKRERGSAEEPLAEVSGSRSRNE